MVKISGFFSHHGEFSLNTIASAIDDIRVTFSHQGKNVLIKEEYDPSGKLPRDPNVIREIFARSATESDLFKLVLECHLPNKADRVHHRLTSNEQTYKRLGVANDYSLRRLWELSLLRKTLEFQLLFESGTSPKLVALTKQNCILVRRLRSYWEVDFDAYVEGLVEHLKVTLETNHVRDELLRQQIDDLIAQYSELNIQVLFGRGHKDMLAPYKGRHDVFLRTTILVEPGNSFLTKFYGAVEEGKELAHGEMLSLYFWRNLEVFSTLICREKGIIVHPGYFFDLITQPLSVVQLKSFFCRDPNERMTATARLLQETGALDALEGVDHKAAVGLRILADNPAGSVITKPLPQNVGRNSLCPCGSGNKYKKCCGK